jgi:hypothetical protein
LPASLSFDKRVLLLKTFLGIVTAPFEPTMLDTVFIAATVVFFAIALAYVWGCTKL